MDDNQIDDLKQFIVITIKNTVSDIVSKSEKRLRKDMRAGFDGIGDAIETLSEHVDKRLEDHGVRITSLEQSV